MLFFVPIVSDSRPLRAESRVRCQTFAFQSFAFPGFLWLVWFWFLWLDVAPAMKTVVVGLVRHPDSLIIRNVDMNRLRFSEKAIEVDFYTYATLPNDITMIMSKKF